MPEEERSHPNLPPADVERSRLAGLLHGPRRRPFMLADAPVLEYEPRYFLTPARPGEADDFVLWPTRPDAMPLAGLVAALLAD